MEMTINLPYNLKGKVAITEVSDSLTQRLNEINDNDLDEDIPALSDYFTVGQYIRCAVKEVKNANERLIVLTCKESSINHGLTLKELTNGVVITGSIKSVEDHGYMVSLGVKDSQAFLPTKNVIPEKEYKIGQLVECYVESANKATVILTTKNVESQKVPLSLLWVWINQ